MSRLFSKIKKSSKVILVEKNKVNSQESKVVEVINDHFNSVYPKNDNLNGYQADDVDEVIKRYQDHPRITKINEQRPLGDMFNFKDITIEVMEKGIANLKTNCSAGWDTVSSKILRSCFNECSSFLAKCFNSYKNSGTFPDELKLANIVPVPKKCGLTLKKNYIPVSVLPVVSKLFECLILNQLLFRQVISYSWWLEERL